MNKTILTVAVLVVVAANAQQALAHCEVPCGIYADQRRFEQMLEDQMTIQKGMISIAELSSESDALSKNQLTRWVITKEEHATNTQHVIAQYFMTQRIKPGSEGYAKKLAAAHAVMVAAMKCKQTVDVSNAKVLRKAILDFYRAYEGKEPNLEG